MRLSHFPRIKKRGTLKKLKREQGYEIWFRNQHNQDTVTYRGLYLNCLKNASEKW